MCATVLVGNASCETQGDLFNLLGGALVIDGDGTFRPAACLCPVNLERTAGNYGYSVRYNSNMDVEFVRGMP